MNLSDVWVWVFALSCSRWDEFYNLTLDVFPFLYSFLFSPQSSEQKQTPVSPRASLPVQPQTRTAVSTPFLFFHLSIQWSYFPQLSHLPLTLPLPFSVSFDVLRDPFENTATAHCQNFYPGWGFKSRARWHSGALCSCWEEKKSVCVRCVCVHDFKRWKCSWSECFAWTYEEFLFGNMEFSQSIQSVRAGHTDSEKPPTCPPSFSFSSHIPRHTLSLSFSLSFSPIGAPTLSPFLPLCSLRLHSFFPVRFSIYLILRESLSASVEGWNTF